MDSGSSFEEETTAARRELGGRLGDAEVVVGVGALRNSDGINVLSVGGHTALTAGQKLFKRDMKGIALYISTNPH